MDELHGRVYHLCYNAAMWLHVWHPPTVLIAVGPITIHWYGLFLALGAAAGVWLVHRLARAQSQALPLMDQLVVWLLVGGLVGARLYHVSNEWTYYQQHADQIFQIWNGGLAMHGGLIGGLLALMLFCRSHKLQFWQFADLLVPGVALGQAIGRWGNYFNQELFGRPTDLPWGLPIDPVNRPAGFADAAYFHPTFLYESIGNLIIVAVLVWLHRRWRPQTDGRIAGAYFLLYGILRMATESIRLDQTPIIAGVRLPIIVSGLIILAGIFILITRHRQSHVRPH